MENKQIIKGNNNITNNGLSVDDALIIANSLFKSNFPLLQQEAEKIVNERIDCFLNSFTAEAEKEGIEDFSCFKSPDMQYAFYDSMKTFARYGTDELLEILNKLLINRMRVDELKIKIAIDNAINIATKLDDESLNYLSLMFLSKQVVFLECDRNTDNLIKKYNDFADKMPISKNHAEYLDSLGCLRICLGNAIETIAQSHNISFNSISGLISNKFKFIHGDYATSHPGTVLAIINIKRYFPDEEFDLNKWIE